MHSSAHLSTPSGSNSSSGPSASGSTMTSRRTSSRTSGTSNSTASKHASAQSSSSASSSSKWKLVRPWQPPSSNTEATLEDGNQHSQQQAHDSEDDDANEDEDGPAEDSASSAVLAPSSSKMKRMHLEVVDVSSTSVSLSVFGQSAQESQMQQNNHRMDTSLGSTSSMANQTTAVRRSRAASTSSERPLSNPPQPPNISIKLNSAAWPHVFHTDASFFDSDSSRQSSDDQSLSSSSILVWGLSPGQNYHIELGVFEEGMDEDDEVAETEELSDISDADESVRAAASVRTLDATEPDVPPPPYSSHDPSSGNDAHIDAEASLRTMLEKLRLTVKQKESALLSSIASMRRANDKLTREDQRHRQRIHMLEDSTSRLREVAADEDAEHDSIREEIEGLEETEKLTTARLERRRRQLEESEKLGREEAEKEEAELAELTQRLDKVTEKEEEVLAKKLKLERELLPTYNIQLATLEADLRRLVDDHRRRFPYQHHLPPHAFSTHLAHSGNLGHMHANHAAHNTRAGRDRIQARALQHQQAQQAQQQQHSSTLAKEQPKLSTVESASKPGQQAYAAESTGEGRSLEALSRQVSNIQQDGKGEKNEAQKAIAANAARADHQQADNSRQGETGRTDSRFAWSNPNSWASKVAGGGRGGESGGNSGVAGGVAGSASSAAGGSVDK